MTRPQLLRSRLSLLLTLCLLFGGAARVFAEVPAPPPDPLVAEVEALFSDAYDAGDPGAAVLLERDGKVLLRKAYGMADLELGVALEPDMVFRIGSITKQFTAVAILMLEADGKLSVKDDIRKHLPDYPTNDKAITLEHLLTHTSGIKSYTSLPGWMELLHKDVTHEEVLELFKDEPMDFDPGARWLYNNSGFYLLGLVIEAASGQDYGTFLEERMFEPLGMVDTALGDFQRVIPRRARGYHRDGETLQNAPYISMKWPYAAGALVSTVDDLSRWNRALQVGEVVPKETLQRLWTDYRTADGESTGYGYGWGLAEVEGHRVIHHGGGIHGFSTFALTVPEEGLFLAVLSNDPANTPSPGFLAQRATSLLLGAAASREVVEVAPEVLGRYEGNFKAEGEDILRSVTIEDGVLRVQFTGNVPIPLHPAGENDFFFDNSLARISFELGDDGRAVAMLQKPWGRPAELVPLTDEKPPELPDSVSIGAEILEQYVGVYELFPGFHLTVTLEREQLSIQGSNQPVVEVYPESETLFFYKVVEAKVEFLRGEDGAVESLMLYQGGQEIPGRKIE